MVTGTARRAIEALDDVDLDEFAGVTSTDALRVSLVHYTFLEQAYVWGEDSPPDRLPRSIARHKRPALLHLLTTPISRRGASLVLLQDRNDPFFGVSFTLHIGVTFGRPEILRLAGSVSGLPPVSGEPTSCVANVAGVRSRAQLVRHVS
jgi:hypothetical protein